MADSQSLAPNFACIPYCAYHYGGLFLVATGVPRLIPAYPAGQNTAADSWCCRPWKNVGRHKRARGGGTIRTAHRDQAFRWSDVAPGLRAGAVILFCTAAHHFRESPLPIRFCSTIPTVPAGAKFLNDLLEPAPCESMISSGSSHRTPTRIINTSDCLETPRVD